MRTIIAQPHQHITIGSSFESDVRSFLLPNLATQRLLLITGERSFIATKESRILYRIFEEAGVTVVKHISCHENPDGATLMREAIDLPAFDHILAIGGGSVIDAAKMLKHITANVPSLSVIYTRFGSGAIVTPFFVYDNHEFKIGEYDQEVIPSHVYVSLELMEGLSLKQRLIGVSDILAHAAESYLSTAGHSSLKIRARTLIESLDTEASHWPLERLVECDIEAGLIESECLVLLPHALGHYLTYAHGVPHGIASIITLPNLIHLLETRQAIDVLLARHISILAKSFTIQYEDISALELQQYLLDDFLLIMSHIRTYMPFALNHMPVPVSQNDVRVMITTVS